MVDKKLSLFLSKLCYSVYEFFIRSSRRQWLIPISASTSLNIQNYNSKTTTGSYNFIYEYIKEPLKPKPLFCIHTYLMLSNS